MSKSILTQNEATVNILTDGVHEYDHPEDKFVVIVDGDEVAWTPTEDAGWIAYNEMTRVECEHQRLAIPGGDITRNPANGLGQWWIIRTAPQGGLAGPCDYTASVSRDGEVSYEDHC